MCIWPNQKHIKIVSFLFANWFFFRFYATHPCVNIGQCMFERLKPLFVRRMKDQNTCCIYHVEIDELQTIFNNMWKAIDDCNSTCDCQICAFTFDACCKVRGEVYCKVHGKVFWESPKYGKALCVRKMNLCNGINMIVYLVNVTSVVSIYCDYVPRKLKDLMTMWSLWGNLLLNKLCQ